MAHFLPVDKHIIDEASCNNLYECPGGTPLPIFPTLLESALSRLETGRFAVLTQANDGTELCPLLMLMIDPPASKLAMRGRLSRAIQPTHADKLQVPNSRKLGLHWSVRLDPQQRSSSIILLFTAFGSLLPVVVSQVHSGNKRQGCGSPFALADIKAFTGLDVLSAVRDCCY